MRSGWGRIAVLVVVVTGLTLSIRYREHINTDVLEQWVAELGVVGPVGFLFVYAIGVLFFFSRINTHPHRRCDVWTGSWHFH